MNMILKSAIGATLALSAMGANALGVPATNNSNVVLVVQNLANPANVYLLDTGVSINSFVATGSTVANASLNNTAFTGLNQTIAASPTLQAFLLANPASGDAFSIEAGQYSGTASTASPTNAATKLAGKAWGIFQSSQNQSNLSGTTLAQFQGFLGGVQGDLTAPTDSLGLTPLNTALEASTGASFSSAGPAAAQGHYGVTPGALDMVALNGSAVTLYGITGNNTTGAVQSYIFGTVSMAANGTLTITGNGGGTTVPLPAAAWLLGSGLMGLVGVSRRRKSA